MFFFSLHSEIEENASACKGKMLIFSNIDSYNEWQKESNERSEREKEFYFAHGLPKQKFIRFMHSRDQCYTNELHFLILGHFSFSLSSFHSSMRSGTFFCLLLSKLKCSCNLCYFPSEPCLWMQRRKSLKIYRFFSSLKTFYVIYIILYTVYIWDGCLMNAALLH